MMDEDFVERRPADLEIYRRLDAFAQVRLTPDAAAMARIRTALMGQALALADARSAALTTPAPLPVALPERPAIGFPRPQRRATAAVLAACLVVGVGAGSVAASQAGGPLYGPRMWIEAATLPSDPMARANAQLGRLDARLQEVRIASGSGNAGAAEAALAAYAVIVADLDAQASANSAVAASLEDGMARRQVVLIGLLDKVPAQAQDAIQHALQQGANAIDGTGEDPHPGNPARPGAGGQGGGGGGGQAGRVKEVAVRARARHGQGQGPAPAPVRDGPDRNRLRTRTDSGPRTGAGPDAEAHEAAQGTGGRSHAGAAAAAAPTRVAATRTRTVARVARVSRAAGSGRPEQRRGRRLIPRRRARRRDAPHRGPSTLDACTPALTRSTSP